MRPSKAVKPFVRVLPVADAERETCEGTCVKAAALPFACARRLLVSSGAGLGDAALRMLRCDLRRL